jgi:hypothetical protein
MLTRLHRSIIAGRDINVSALSVGTTARVNLRGLLQEHTLNQHQLARLAPMLELHLQIGCLVTLRDVECVPQTSQF